MKKRSFFYILIMITTITINIKAEAFGILESVDGYIRTGYQYMDIKDDHASADVATGGKLHIETSSWQNMNAGISFYSTNVLFGENEGNGIPFFDAENRSYTLIGEAYIKGEWDQTMLKIGRQEIDTPFADTDDIGMIPNTFEAIVAINQDLPDTTLFFAHLYKMSGVDADDTSTFTKINSDHGIQTAGITYEGIDRLSLAAWYYRMDNLDIDAIAYAEAIYENNIGDFALLFGVQYAAQSYAAMHDAGIYGIQAIMTFKPAGLSLGGAYNHSAGNTAFNGFGGGPYFTSSEHLTLAEAGKNGKATRISADWEAKSIGLSDLTLSTGCLMLEDKNGEKAKEIDIVVHYDYSETLGFDLIYSDVDDTINATAFNNLRVYANYRF